MDTDKVHNNTKQRADLVCELVRKYYEPENQSKCMQSVWKFYVYPVMPISLRTFQRYCKIGGISWLSLQK